MGTKTGTKTHWRAVDEQWTITLEQSLILGKFDPDYGVFQTNPDHWLHFQLRAQQQAK